jgi:hypothetical protein
MGAVMLASGIQGLQFSWDAVMLRGGFALVSALVGLVAGGFVTPVLLPWVPGRLFALKGALVGAVLAAPVTLAAWEPIGALAASATGIASVVIASYVAMNFTGTSAITSPSGVEYEMRRALPWQVAGAVAAIALWLASAFV